MSRALDESCCVSAIHWSRPILSMGIVTGWFFSLRTVGNKLEFLLEFYQSAAES